MERLWAPWRLNYVKTIDNKQECCVFCLVPDKVDDEKFVLQRGKHCFTIMNIFPYNNGHLMIAPYRHIGDFSSLTGEEKLEIIDMLTLWLEILQEVMHCHGFNVGLNLGSAAGAGIKDHLHFHIVPRWIGDTNFMPVLGDVKIIPQSLDECFKSLKEKFKERINGTGK